MPYVRFHAVAGGDPNGPPIAGVTVSGQSPILGNWQAEPTNACGDTFALLAPGEYDVTFHKAGYADAGYYPASIGQEGGAITKGLERGGSGPLPPVGGPLLNLQVNGQFFALDGGARWTAVECSDFNLLNRWQNGENIMPQLSQRAALGFNLLRVWTLFDIPGIGTMPICAYHRIPEFVGLCAAYGLYVEFTAYTGINDPLHWEFLCDAAWKCSPRALCSLVNELDANTNEPDSAGRIFQLDLFSKPDGVLSSHGSNGSQAQPIAPFWDYTEYHTNDAPSWWLRTGYNAVADRPTLINENTRMPDHDSDRAHADEAARWSALLNSGSCFHSPRGKTSEVWDGVELDCALAWAQGARSVDLVTRHRPIPNNDTHALFLSAIDGRDFGQSTLLDIAPTLGEYGIMLTPPNAAGERTKIADPVSQRWTRVGFGEGQWVWVVQGDGIYANPATAE